MDGYRVEQDPDQDGVLAHWRRGEGPQLVLDWILRNVPANGFGIESKFYAVSLELRTSYSYAEVYIL